MFEKSVYPAGKVACAVGEYRIGRKVLLKQANNRRHVNIARQFIGLQVSQVISICFKRPCLPRYAQRGGQHLQRSGSGIHGGVDRQVGLVNTVKFFCTAMDVYQLLLWPGRFN